jgi:DNA-binding transcriptional LysR family regulator
MRSDWLASYVVFCEHMNLTQAAQALHLSQPALHAQLQRLAEEVGAPLYEREGRGLRLTAQGEAVAGYARQEARRRRVFLEELRVGRRGEPVVLATGEGAAQYLLGEGLGRFVAQGEAPLRLLIADRRGCVEALRAGRAQLAVTTEGALVEGMARWPLAQVWPVVALPPGDPLHGAARVPLAALEGSALVVPPAGSAWRERLGQALEAAGVRWSVALEAPGWALALKLVSLGVGRAVVNGCCEAPAGVALVPVEGLEATRYVILGPEQALEGPAEALRGCLLGSVRAWGRAASR